MRVRMALLVLVLLAAACGDDDGTASTEGPTTTEGATTTQAATTDAPTTSEAPTTTEAATTTTADPMAAVEALIAEYEGDYEGTWSNTTYGSEGPIAATITYDADSASLIADVDLGGRVFGSVDPDPETIAISLAGLNPSGGSFTIASATFGEMQVTVTEDGIEAYSDDVPDPRIATILVTGPLTPGGFELAYVIEFEGGGGAEGTVSVQMAG